MRIRFYFGAPLLACVACSTINTASVFAEHTQHPQTSAAASAVAAEVVRPLLLVKSLVNQNNQTAAGAATITTAAAPQTTRERRAQAYAKMLEGQRRLSGARSARQAQTAVQGAEESFRSAAELDPTLAEAHTALAELAFFREDLETIEREATTAIKISPDNFGARRILSRLYVLRSGLAEGKPNRKVIEQAVAALREVVRLDSNNAEAWALLGEMYFATARAREAVDAFTRWAAAPTAVDGRFYTEVTRGRELSPDSAAARLGEALLQTGRTTEAIAALRRAVALEPTNQGYLNLLGQALEASGDSSSALAEVERAVAADPNNNAALSRLARLQARNGQVDQAIATLRNRITQRATKDNDQILLRVELAQILAVALRYDESIAIYNELLKERGITAVDGPLQSPEDQQFAGGLLQQIAITQRQAGRFTDALATVERLRRLTGNNAEADFQQIFILREQGKRPEALLAIQAARPRYPEDDRLIRLEALTLTELGRVEEGVTLLRARLKGQPDDYGEYTTIAGLYLQAGRAAEAVEAARKAVDLASANRPELVTDSLVLLSSAQERAGDAKGSEESLRRVLIREPNNPTALNNLGYFLVERNERLSEALELIQRAVRYEPMNGSFLDSLGWAYFKLNRLDEAEQYLGEAARRSSNSATVQEHLGDVYERRGKSDQARAAWGKALSLATEQTETTRIKAKLNGKSR